jgi:hypothetical protein
MPQLVRLAIAAFGGLALAADQGRQHVAVCGVVIVALAIQIGGQLLLFEKAAPTQGFLNKIRSIAAQWMSAPFDGKMCANGPI